MRGEPDTTLMNIPGTVYLGPVTGPRHQVHHEPFADGEALLIEGLGSCSVTVMLRCALFAKCRSRLRNVSPTPREFFELLADTFREGLAGGTWQLPTLQECQVFAA